MPTLTITVPDEHAKVEPSGTHVNGRHVEWPPSPWRICRALLATGMSRLGWRADDLPPSAIELLTTLTSVHPEYRLPPSMTVAYSGHCAPTKDKPTRVFDGLPRVGDATLKVGWDVDLSPAAFMLFAELAECLSDLDRAESWAMGFVTPSPLRGANCRPCLGPEIDPDAEPVTLLAPMTDAGFKIWRDGQLDALGEASPKMRQPDRKGPVAPIIPNSIIDAMLQSTAELRAQGWSAPPGSRKLLYTRPEGSIVAAQPAPTRRLTPRAPVEYALIALSSSAIRGESLPQLHLALPQMESLHRGLASLVEKGQACPELTGRDAANLPLQGGHRHAHYIPLSLGDRGPETLLTSDAPIDHILIYAPCGLTYVAQQAIERLRWIGSVSVCGSPGTEENRARRSRHRLTTTLVAAGDISTIRGALHARNRIDLYEESRVWQSHTPFIAPRFVKKKHPIPAQIQAELASRGLPPAASIEVMPHDAATDAGFQSFVRRRRRNKPQPPSEQPWSLRISFDAPLRGPILALGYGSHFGLGLLRPADPR